MAPPKTPVLTDVVCLTDCVGLREPTIGGTVQVDGRHLSEVSRMSFKAKSGRILAPAFGQSATTAEARVPAGAVDGPVRVRDDFGGVSNLSRTTLDIRPRSELGASGPLRIVSAAATPHKAFYDGLNRPTLAFVVGANRPTSLRIDVVSSKGAVVRSFFRREIDPNTTQSQLWAGKDESGKPAPSGSYYFRIRSPNGESARRGSTDIHMAFHLYGFIFPVRGRHDFGTAINRFGAPRAGHTHQGQDVLAGCGEKLVAARGGKVQYSGYEANAGYYVVIDQKGSGYGNMYAHLVRHSPLSTGDTVRTGQQIGNVGETGDAVGCHLHFELWTPPGWYLGGHPIDPLPYLRKWDRYS